MPAVLFGLGVILIVFTFLLVFTIVGEISALAGLVCIASGAMLLGRRTRRSGTD
jgi:hypothetical protein